MKNGKLAFVDAETKPVGLRPDYPPQAVGYAVKHGRHRKYLSFGHPEGNNCTKREAVSYLKTVLRDHTPVFHNAEFDLEVMEKDGVRYSGEYHDTMKLAFLAEPRSMDLGLKPQAEEWLDEPPEERDALKQWIIDNIPGAKRRKTKWGEYICECPGRIVQPYAVGDVVRTDGLYRVFTDEIREAGMEEAYRREMAMGPIKLAMENGGIRVRLAKLKREIGVYIALREKLAKSIARRLGTRMNTNFTNNELAAALVDADLLSVIVKTPTGKVSTKRVILEENCTDKKLVELLGCHSILGTYIGTFLQKWIDIAEINDGYIQPTFNTVRSFDEYGGGKSRGTRTGRFSSSEPNFQNLPNNVEGSQHEAILRILQKHLRNMGVDFVGLRDYLAPDEGHVFLRRDYNQQELRILAHFEAGQFLQMYLDDPTTDAHDAVKELVARNTGMDFPRKHIKITNFGIIYGQGIAKLAGRLGIEDEAARILKRAVMKAVPGIKNLQRELRTLARHEEPFYTWGGRRYYCEEPAYVATDDGGKEKRTYEYKMLNTKIQGSAADCTKEGMINTYHALQSGRLVLQVHDELVASVPKKHVKREMRNMMEAMEDVKFALPMLSDGEIGSVSLARMKKYTGDRR